MRINLQLTHKPITDLSKISSEKGLRNRSGSAKMHNGIDFRVPIGTEVKNVATGRIVKSIENHNEYGNVVVVKHAGNYYTLYAHLDSIQNRENPDISAGELIGLSGNTGKSDGAHLHFEIIDGEVSFTQPPNKGLPPQTRLIHEWIDTYSSSIGIGVQPWATCLNPRHYLASAFPEFPVTVEAGLSGLELEGDSRGSQFTGNARNNVFNGLGGVDTYKFPDMSQIGVDRIVDENNDGILMLDGVQVDNPSIACVKDSETGETAADKWVMDVSGTKYYLIRVNDNNIVDINGKHLMIVNKDAADNSNSIRINNFDFVNGGFGIDLKNIDSQILVSGYAFRLGTKNSSPNGKFAMHFVVRSGSNNAIHVFDKNGDLAETLLTDGDNARYVALENNKVAKFKVVDGYIRKSILEGGVVLSEVNTGIPGYGFRLGTKISSTDGKFAMQFSGEDVPNNVIYVFDKNGDLAETLLTDGDNAQYVPLENGKIAKFKAVDGIIRKSILEGGVVISEVNTGIPGYGFRLGTKISSTDGKFVMQFSGEDIPNNVIHVFDKNGDLAETLLTDGDNAQYVALENNKVAKFKVVDGYIRKYILEGGVVIQEGINSCSSIADLPQIKEIATELVVDASDAVIAGDDNQNIFKISSNNPAIYQIRNFQPEKDKLDLSVFLPDAEERRLSSENLLTLNTHQEGNIAN